MSFTRKTGDLQLRYYDSQTFLMVRMDSLQRMRRQKDGPESAYQVKTSYLDYRHLGGINFPREIRATASNGELVLNVETIQTNKPIKDSLFQKN